MATSNRVLNVSIVGAGKVGSALALLFRSKGIRVVSVISRRKAAARKTASLAGCKRYSNKLSDIHPGTNFLLLAVADDQIRRVARMIASTARLSFRDLRVAHTSGILTSDELLPLARLGAAVFSLHPMQSFPGKLSSREQLRAFEGISYGVEGSAIAMRFANRLVRRIGGKVFRVPNEAKILYHLACVVASNYSVALLSAVDELASGISKAAAFTHFRKLTESSIQNAYRTSPRRALTGPIARGDARTVQMHLKRLTGKRQHLKQLYKTLGQLALGVARRDKRLSSKQTRRLKSALR